ncbi:VC0807 family protein [Pseudonocardia phyllosphaerae]|uniref:VC0807 family protein n=1 Tax=Pseudonocardia phyllosphaerae TaxID=3390502 RepID=UPI00397D0923
MTTNATSAATDTREVTTVAENNASIPAGPGMLLRGLALDVGLPVAVYYLLFLCGAPDPVSLLAASGVAAARVVWSAVRRRTLNAFATVMLIVYGAGFLLVFVSGDPRSLLLRTSLISAALGVVFLVTAIRGRRPLTLAAMQSFAPDKAAGAAREFESDPAVRHGHRVSSTVWGVGLLAEAALRVPMVYLLPIPVAVGATEALLVVTLVALAAWNVWYVRRARAR